MSVLREQRLQRIRQAHGVDWFPSWARTPVDYWNASMPRDAAARELRLVSGLGLDHVRIWLSAWGYEQDPARYVDNLRFVLDTAQELGLGVVLELFDSCGCEPGDAEVVRVGDVPRLAAGMEPLAFMQAFEGRGGDVFGAPALVEVPWQGTALAAVWEGFVPNPGYAFLGPEHWDRWESYAAAVVELVRDHPAMLLLEVMNEPFITHIGEQVDLAPVVAFYQHMADFVRPLAPELPLAIGAEQSGIVAHDSNAPGLDVISFHSLSGADQLREAIETATKVAGDRPVYLSEWGFFPGGTDEQQLAELRTLLPIMLESGIGWAITHLIAGYGPFGNTALIYPSGVMRPGASYLRGELSS